MSSSFVPDTGSRLNPWAMARSSAWVTVELSVTTTMSGCGTITSRADGVAELDDALDQLALLVLDHLVLGGRLDDAQQLELAHERPFLETLAREQDVGEPDQAPRDQRAAAGTTRPTR